MLAALAGIHDAARAAVKSIDVPPKHPRLYLRRMDLAELHRRLLDPAMTLERRAITGSPRPMALALHGLLDPGAVDAKSGRHKQDAAIESALAALRRIDDRRNFQFELLKEFHQAACVYDWCYDALTEPLKQEFIGQFVRLARGKDGGGFPIDRAALPSLVGHVAQGSILGNHLAAGLAIHDEEPTMFADAAAAVLEDYAAASRFLFPGIADLSGVYYARHQHFATAVLLFRKIGLEDVFDRALSRMPYEWIYALRPDGRMLRSGDTLDDEGRARRHRYTFSMIGALFGDSLLVHMGEADLRDVPLEAPHRAKYRHYDRLSSEELIIRFLALSPEIKRQAREHRGIGQLPRVFFAPPPAARMIFRTGWDLGTDRSRDALVDMRIGEYFIGNHQRKDFGTFQIYFRGPLAIASGVYQGSRNSWYGQPHWIDYYQQTVSVNGLLIHDPAEQPFLAGPRANDGGQRWPNGGNNHPRNIAELTDPANGYRMGRLIAHAVGPGERYGFISGDITHAYSAKAEAVVRSMLAIRTGLGSQPLIFIVSDYVRPSDPELRRTFLLHSVAPPALAGRRAVIVNRRRTLTLDRGIFSGTYNGRLVLESLSPVGAALALVEGHTIGGVSFQATKPEANGEEGWGRLEISEAGSKDTDFLNVMTVMDADGPEPPDAMSLQGDGFLGVRVMNEAAVFPRRAGWMAADSAIEIPGEATANLFVAGLEPGIWELRSGNSIARVSKSAAHSLSASFDALEPGRYTLRFLRPA